MVRIILKASTKEDLSEKIKKYEQDYPFAGYGTTFSAPYYNELTKEWEVKVSRLQSCD